MIARMPVDILQMSFNVFIIVSVCQVSYFSVMNATAATKTGKPAKARIGEGILFIAVGFIFES